MAKWSFSISDNSGKKQFFTVTANNKADAIEKSFKRARKNARGDLSPHWECKLIRA